MSWRSPTAQTVGLRIPLQLRERAQELPPESLGRKAMALVRVGIHLVGPVCQPGVRHPLPENL